MKEIHLQTCLAPGRLEAGCDEAGRGPLAGPVSAAAVILPPDFHHPLLNDSKQTLTVGSTVYAFKTPSSGGTPLVVSGASTPTLSSGVTVSGGTSYFEGLLYQDASISGGSSVSLSSYTGGNGGGGGPGGGGHGPF